MIFVTVPILVPKTKVFQTSKYKNESFPIFETPIGYLNNAKTNNNSILPNMDLRIFSRDIFIIAWIITH